MLAQRRARTVVGGYAVRAFYFAELHSFLGNAAKQFVRLDSVYVLHEAVIFFLLQSSAHGCSAPCNTFLHGDPLLSLSLHVQLWGARAITMLFRVLCRFPVWKHCIYSFLCLYELLVNRIRLVGMKTAVTQKQTLIYLSLHRPETKDRKVTFSCRRTQVSCANFVA